MGPHAPRLAELLARQTDKQFCGSCLARALQCSLEEVRAESTFSRGAGQCTVCGAFSVVYGHPAGPEARPPEERLTGFLRQKAGAFFCHTCLGRELRMSPYLVRKAADRLRRAGTARLQGGRCATCVRLKLVIGHGVGDPGGAIRPGIV